MTTTDNKEGKIFARVIPHKAFMEMIKEARRVKYIVEGEPKDHYVVKDDETGDTVFSGIRHSSGGWLGAFSSLYWQEPEMLA
jgi:hypothetical protein